MLNHDKNNLKCYPQQFESFCFVYNHTHTSMQWCCTMVKEPGPETLTGMCTRTPQKLTRYLHRAPPEPQQVSALEPLEPSGTLPGISTNMNWYKRNHVGWHAVTSCIWSCVRHHDIMPTLSYNHSHTRHTDTIIRIQPQPCNDVAHRHATRSHKKLYKHIMCKCSLCTLLCSESGPAVDKIVYESAATLFMSLRQATNMNSYIRNHCGLHVVTNCIWSCGRHDRRKFRSQTSDNMDRWKAEQGRGREKRKIRREKIRRERVRKKEDADARKGRKVAKHCVFPMICGSGGSKSRLEKAAGAEPAGQMSDEKLHAVVARSRFPSQNVQNTPVSDHFWKLRCQKSARRCGAKHISKSKCTKHTSVGPLLEVEMSKKCTPLWREAHFQVKMYKTHQLRTTFGSWDVEKVHAVVARSTFPNQNVQNTTCSRHFWRFGCWKSARRCGAKHISKSKCTKH